MLRHHRPRRRVRYVRSVHRRVRAAGPPVRAGRPAPRPTLGAAALRLGATPLALSGVAAAEAEICAESRCAASIAAALSAAIAATSASNEAARAWNNPAVSIPAVAHELALVLAAGGSGGGATAAPVAVGAASAGRATAGIGARGGSVAIEWIGCSASRDDWPDSASTALAMLLPALVVRARSRDRTSDSVRLCPARSGGTMAVAAVPALAAPWRLPVPPELAPPRDPGAYTDTDARLPCRDVPMLAPVPTVPGPDIVELADGADPLPGADADADADA